MCQKSNKLNAGCVYVCVCVLSITAVQHLVDTICPICGPCHADNGAMPPCNYNLTIPKIIRDAELINNLRKCKQQQLL